jgi:superfamily II DNA helicase RecQ
MSATLAPRVRKDVLLKLQYDKTNYIDLNVGNDRPNVSIVVRAIQNQMNTYSDLDFLVPDSIQRPEDIKKTFLYVDNVSTQVDIEERLYECLPASFRAQGVIRPYSATFSSEHRTKVMSLYKEGIIRILICTDAAGMVLFFHSPC